MDVKACDNCRKSNLETDLLTVHQLRKARAGDRPGISDPLVGFWVERPDARNGEVMSIGPMTLISLLCKPCIEKEVDRMLRLL